MPNVLRTKARLIIMYREEHGPFASVDDLLNVQGIGPETLESMRPYIYV
ncbi:ComEA family DNA-binding protein [Solibaculum intestinale]|uniref:Helix-hairpin-helix domain-containing protein n=1 Tax=Solibaculum intestinale TaxID=3133165 RepID=A0ABV1E565_9FIRM